MMRLGIVTYNVARDWDLETLLSICREAGLEGVEFRTGHAHGVEPSLPIEKRREVRRKCEGAGIHQISLGSTCEFHSTDLSEVRRNIAQCTDFIRLAKDIGAIGVKVRPNDLPDDIPAEQTILQIGESLAECGRIAADYGVEIWMEVHGRRTQEPGVARKIMDCCGEGNVGVTWNSNSADVINGSVRQSFELLKPFIRCCHITELWNNYPWTELFNLLNQSVNDIFALCEIGVTIAPEDGATFMKCYKGLWKRLQA